MSIAHSGKVRPVNGLNFLKLTSVNVISGAGNKGLKGFQSIFFVKDILVTI